MRVCWYRALLERPPAGGVHSAGQLLATCSGLAGLQRSGCLTGASLIRSDDPAGAAAHAAATSRGPEAADCLRGLRVQTYALAPFATQLGLIRGCANMRSAQRACYEWLGKTLNVITNGTFETRGCTKLRYAASRASCVAGRTLLHGRARNLLVGSRGNRAGEPKPPCSVR